MPRQAADETTVGRLLRRGEPLDVRVGIFVIYVDALAILPRLRGHP